METSIPPLITINRVDVPSTRAGIRYHFCRRRVLITLYVYVLNSILSAGGTTACVAAGRLAACDPSLKILILEAGPHTLNKAAHVQPYLYPSNISPTSNAFTFNVANPSPSLNGRAPVVSCGHCVGGGSSVNCS